MKVCVIGLGYIGLPTACIINSKGINVVGVDIREEYINKIKSGRFVSEEKTLDTLISESLKNENFSVKISPEKADVFILCTPTPIDENKKPDLSSLIHGVESILPYIVNGNMIIIESTIPPKTISNIIRPILECAGLIVGEDIFLAHCPERVIPGNIIYELIHNSRIIGGYTQRCNEKIRDFYSLFVEGEIFVTRSDVAEMVKLVENTHRDVNLALANEITMICNQLSIDPFEVIQLANKHPRVNLLQPGIGVGGHCLPVDPYFIVDNVPDISILIQISRFVNENVPKYVASKITKLLSSINGSKIGVWGISYKANTDDIRNSPSLEIVKLLNLEGYTVNIYDPCIENYKSQIHKDKTIIQSDLLLIMVRHDDFLNEDFNLLSESMKSPIIFDAVNLIDGSNLTNKFKLYNLGTI